MAQGEGDAGGSRRQVIGTVEYNVTDERYFHDRALRRHAGALSLWALGVGAVISGDFFGWNFGLAAGGFGGLLIATGIIAAMYVAMCLSIAEMSAALPHTGGAYSFGRSAMGPWGGFVTGLAENMEYVLTPAVIVVGIGGYMGAIVESWAGLEIPPPIWWALFYALFVGLNVWGVEATFRFAVFITVVSLGVLALFWIGAVPHFSWEHAFNIQPEPGRSRFLPFGWNGVAAALPFAVWFYLAIEQLPLAAEESLAPEVDMPRGLVWGIATLIVASLLTLLLSAGIPPGAEGVGRSEEPLLLGFRTILGPGDGASLAALCAVTGLVASFHTIIYAYGRNIYSLSRAGYFPHWLSLTGGGRRTPHIALVAGAVIGYAVALVIHYGGDWFGGVPVGAVLLNMAVFGAVIAYVMQMLAFVRLRAVLPHIPRPFSSPLGNAGAVFAGLVALVTLGTLFLHEDYAIGVWGCAAWFAAGLLYFAIWGRHQLVFSPEEEFAVRARRRHRDQPPEHDPPA